MKVGGHKASVKREPIMEVWGNWKLGGFPPLKGAWIKPCLSEFFMLHMGDDLSYTFHEGGGALWSGERSGGKKLKHFIRP